MQDFFLRDVRARTCRSLSEQDGPGEEYRVFPGRAASFPQGTAFRGKRALPFFSLFLPFEDIPQMVPYAGDIVVTAPWRPRVVMPDSLSGRAVAAHALRQNEAGHIDVVAGMEKPAQGDVVAAYPEGIDLHEADVEGQPPRKAGLRQAQSFGRGTREDIFSLDIDEQRAAVRLLTGYGQSEHAGDAEAPAGFLKERSQGFFAAVQGGSGGKREVQEESRNK